MGVVGARRKRLWTGLALISASDAKPWFMKLVHRIVSGGSETNRTVIRLCGCFDGDKLRSPSPPIIALLLSVPNFSLRGLGAAS